MKFAILTASAILAIVILVLIAGPAAARGVSLEMAQPLQSEVFERAPVTDIDFHPLDIDTARTSAFWNAFPEPLQVELFEKNPTEAVKQPPQCDDVCLRNPTEAVKQPPQCDDVCLRNPTEAVKQPPQCDTVCEKNPSQAVRQPLDIECCGPTMSFRLKEDAHAEIAIYNVNGRLVRTLSEVLPSGESSLTWDGMDYRGSRAASGVYFARVQASQETGKGKLVLVH